MIFLKIVVAAFAQIGLIGVLDTFFGPGVFKIAITVYAAFGACLVTLLLAAMLIDNENSSDFID